MKIQASVIVIALICGVIAGADRNGSPSKPLQLEVSIFDESPKPKLKQRFTVVVSDGGTIHYVDGGEFPPDDAGSGLPFGTRLDGSITQIPTGDKRVELTVEIGNRVLSNEARTQVVVAEVVRVRTDLVIGKAIRIHCGGQRYCTLRLD